MAFLCPVRIRRNKKKDTTTEYTDDSSLQTPTLGRITGSSSIETLVRVGLEKEAGQTSRHIFCTDDDDICIYVTVNTKYEFLANIYGNR